MVMVGPFSLPPLYRTLTGTDVLVVQTCRKTTTVAWGICARPLSPSLLVQRSGPSPRCLSSPLSFSRARGRRWRAERAGVPSTHYGVTGTALAMGSKRDTNLVETYCSHLRLLSYRLVPSLLETCWELGTRLRSCGVLGCPSLVPSPSEKRRRGWEP